MGRKRKTENKVVVRTYYSKKLGKMVTKRYEYERSAYATKKTNTRKYVDKLQAKTGKKYKAWDKFLSKYDSIGDRAILNAIAKTYQNQNKVLTEARALYELKKEKIISALDNTGYSIEEIANQIGTKPENLINTENWDGSVYTDPETNKKYQYEWTYEGTVLNEIN